MFGFGKREGPQVDGPFVVDSFVWGHKKGSAADTQPLQDLLNRRHAEGYELVHMNTIPAGTMRGMHEQTSYLVWRRT